MNANKRNFKEILLKQMKEYLDGEITKEEYYALAESYYSDHTEECDDQVFKKFFLETVADACTCYIDEPGLEPELKEREFRKVLEKAYNFLKET